MDSLIRALTATLSQSHVVQDVDILPELLGTACDTETLVELAVNVDGLDWSFNDLLLNALRAIGIASGKDMLEHLEVQFSRSGNPWQATTELWLNQIWKLIEPHLPENEARRVFFKAAPLTTRFLRFFALHSNTKDELKAEKLVSVIHTTSSC